MPVNTTYLSDQTTNLSNLSLNGANSANMRASSYSGAAVRVSSLTATRIEAASGPILAATSLDLRTNSAVISMVTVANTTGMTIGQLRLVFQASGVSLMYSSGATVYTVGASAVSAVQG